MHSHVIIDTGFAENSLDIFFVFTVCTVDDDKIIFNYILRNIPFGLIDNSDMAFCTKCWAWLPLLLTKLLIVGS